METDTTLADLVIRALESDPGATAAKRAVSIEDVRVQVIASFPEERAAGYVTDALEQLDRELRFAARSVETGVAVKLLRLHGSRPIPVAEGLMLAAVEAGSVKLRFGVSERLRNAIETNAAVILLAVLDIFGAAVNVQSVFFDHDTGATHIHIEHDGTVDVQAPSGVEFHFERANERVIVAVRAASPPSHTASPPPPSATPGRTVTPKAP